MVTRRRADREAEAFIRKVASSDYAQLGNAPGEAAEIVWLYDRPHPGCFRKGVSPETRGEKNKSAKLKEADVAKIKKKLSGPHHHGIYRELAREYGVTPQCIYNIRDGVNWKHVKPPP